MKLFYSRGSSCCRGCELLAPKAGTRLVAGEASCAGSSRLKTGDLRFPYFEASGCLSPNLSFKDQFRSVRTPATKDTYLGFGSVVSKLCILEEPTAGSRLT